VDPDILEHYETAEEWDRMNRPRGRLELLRTQELLTRHLPPAPGTVLDVGGGPGVYAEWLAGLGYAVHLVDPVPRHLEQTLARGAEEVTAAVGDARALAEADASVDAVLLLGPLYHLTERRERVQALREAARVVRPGGLVAAAAISRFASLYDGLTLGFLASPGFAARAAHTLETGQHRNPTKNPDWFTTSYFHHPDDLVAEVADAGLTDVVRYGIEGPGAWLHGLDQQLEDPEQRELILMAARRLETEPTMAGVSPHLLAVGYRPV
jgi:ubiquinone/menaquinone biosynthesis C-methylase UbiE